MSQLFLVRHGQASFLESNYDRLSAKGEAQSRMLGEYWARHQMVFDRVYSGPKVRQTETARIAGEACRSEGIPWPESTVLREFDEFQAEAVLEKSLPGLLETDAHVRQLHQDFKESEARDDQFRTFQRIFEVVIGRWAKGEIPLPEIEPWPDFCQRVQKGLAQLTGNGGPNQRIAIFSSGGPVAVAMQRALDLSSETTLRTAWMVRNSSYSEFLFSSNRFTLSSYNASPHLTDAAFLTYR
ncbi:MAG TPA: histidine phosphatase family protein [Verrucomicrobiae bacterium]|jgi:broad specificity phosphatase PhoE|nr:histidine phosphatase family protein [Verrucomicrobiae bacterium]